MQELQKFINQEFGEIRTFTESNGNVTFCAADIANALKYSNTRDAIIRHCKSDGVVFHDIIDGKGRPQQLKFITKGNMCRLVAHSKLPSAEKFESWIFDDVIPTVLEKGIYATDDTIDNIIKDPDFGIKILTELKQEREEKRQLQDQINHQKPLVDFASTVQGSDTNILIRQTSKFASNYIGVDIGEKDFIKDCVNGVLYARLKMNPLEKHIFKVFLNMLNVLQESTHIQQ